MDDRSTRAWFVVFAVALFLGGLGGGVVLDRLVARPRLRPMAAAGRPFMAFERTMPAFAPVKRGLANDLDLTTDQRAKLDGVFAAWGDHIEQFRGDVRLRYETLQKGLREEIENMLTPDQRKKFQEWLTREQLPGLRPGRGMGPGRGMAPGRGMGGSGRRRSPGPGF